MVTPFRKVTNGKIIDTRKIVFTCYLKVYHRRPFLEAYVYLSVWPIPPFNTVTITNIIGGGPDNGYIGILIMFIHLYVNPYCLWYFSRKLYISTLFSYCFMKCEVSQTNDVNKPRECAYF